MQRPIRACERETHTRRPGPGEALRNIAAIAWMADLLHLPRLFFHPSEAAEGPEGSETFKVVQRLMIFAALRVTPPDLAPPQEIRYASIAG